MADIELHDDEETAKLVPSAPYYQGQKVVDCEKSIRLGFIRKVYGILSIQLLATIAVCACAMQITGGQVVGDYEVLSLGSWIVSSRPLCWTIFVTTFVILMTLLCFKNSYPINYVLLSIWTVALSLTVASSCVIVLCDPIVETANGVLVPLSIATDPAHTSLYKGGLFCAVDTDRYKSGTNIVLLALGITSTIFLGLTTFTFQSKWDFSFLGASLSAALWALLLWGFVMAIFGGGAQIQYLYSLAGSVIFSLYIVFDTWQARRVLFRLHSTWTMTKSRQVACKYGPDDYIMAAIDLYLDILNLFLFILRMLAERRD